jgi:RES domain-containing protein
MAILEVAVHMGFRVLDTVPHVMTATTTSNFAGVHVVAPDQIPNPNWLRPGIPSAGQQAFDRLLREHTFVAVPSVASTDSWNLLFTAGSPGYELKVQERFALDPRLHPPATP